MVTAAGVQREGIASHVGGEPKGRMGHRLVPSGCLRDLLSPLAVGVAGRGFCGSQTMITDDVNGDETTWWG